MKFFVTALTLLAVLSVGFSPAAAEDCVDVEIDISRFVPPVPVVHFSVYFSIVNCGSEFAVVECIGTLEQDGQLLGAASVDIPLGAGQEFLIDQRVPINPNIEIPTGTCRLCITVISGTSVDMSCATIVVDEDGNVQSFVLETSNTPTEELTWGAIKSLFR